MRYPKPESVVLIKQNIGLNSGLRYQALNGANAYPRISGLILCHTALNQ